MTSGLPATVAACTAADTACWVFVVGLKASIPHLGRRVVRGLSGRRTVNVRKVEPVPLNLPDGLWRRPRLTSSVIEVLRSVT
ncbi:hypothetical protein GCM10009660_21310 [Catellatospora bangladeshensis]